MSYNDLLNQSTSDDNIRMVRSENRQRLFPIEVTNINVSLVSLFAYPIASFFKGETFINYSNLSQGIHKKNL